MPNSLHKIRHFVVLMMENRSFDHMLGFLRSDTYPIEGLKGDESNPSDFTTGSRLVPVTKEATYHGDYSVDPSHELAHVNVQLYGNPAGPDPLHPERRNKGFVVDYASLKGNTSATAGNVMKCFSPERLPVLTTLAREFAVCDYWFCSLPAQTWPNRFFIHCATSDGLVDNSAMIDRRTIYHNLNDRNVSWFLYWGDAAQAWMIRSMASLGNNGPSGSLSNPVEYFADAAARGSLPEYTFLEPRYFASSPNDQHPDHDVDRGETLIADVYEALRNSPVWNETLLIILYDEHGGLFDHVPPSTQGVVPPEEKIYQGGRITFRFDRLGPRVPALLISPYIKKGTIDHTIYDHTSVPAMLKKAFGLPRFLTQRDAAAATLEENLALETPRTDTPETLPRPAAQLEATEEEGSPKLNDLQRDMLRGLDQLGHEPTANPNVRAQAARLAAGRNPY
jgi:phospholipase C